MIFFRGPIGRYFSIFCEVSRAGEKRGFWLPPQSGRGHGKVRKRPKSEPFHGGRQKPTFFPAPLTSQKRCIIPNQWAEKQKITHPRYKKLIANRGSYSCSRNAIIPMIRRFYFTTSYKFSGNHEKVSTLIESKILSNAVFVLR